MDDFLTALNNRGRADVLKYFAASIENFKSYQEYIEERYKELFAGDEFAEGIVLPKWRARRDWVTGTTLPEYHLFHSSLEKLKTQAKTAERLTELNAVFKVEYNPHGTTWTQLTSDNDLVVNLNLWRHANNWLQVGVRRPGALPEYFGSSSLIDHLSEKLDFEHRPEHTHKKMAELLVLHIRKKTFEEQFSNAYAITYYTNSLSRFNFDFFAAAEFELLHEIYHFLPSPIEDDIANFTAHYRDFCEEGKLTFLLDNFEDCASEIRADLSAAYTLMECYGPQRFERLIKQVTINFMSAHIESHLPYLIGLPGDWYEKVPSLVSTTINGPKTHPSDLIRAKLLTLCIRSSTSFLAGLGRSRAESIDKSFLEFCRSLERIWNASKGPIKQQYHDSKAIFNLPVIAGLNGIKQQIDTGDIYLNMVDIGMFK